jgi:hypothetical protein
MTTTLIQATDWHVGVCKGSDIQDSMKHDIRGQVRDGKMASTVKDTYSDA